MTITKHEPIQEFFIHHQEKGSKVLRSIGRVTTLDRPSFLGAAMKHFSWDLINFRRDPSGNRVASDGTGGKIIFIRK